MSNLKTNPSPEEMTQIKSPYVLAIIKIIKQIQARMKDPDLKDLEYSRLYDTLSKEFDEFFNKFTNIFIKVTRGESLDIIAANLYYLDQVVQGKISEAQVADMLATQYLPAHLKADSDAKLKEMKEEKHPDTQ
jgi:hypothetical protein